MTDLQLSGLRLWLSSLVHWPGRRLHERIDASEHWLEDVRDGFEAELERRVRHFERTAAAWAVTALLLAIAGIFLLIGLWLGFSQLLGRVTASLLLAAAFAALALIPIAILRKILRD
jgi:hypothetical protein